MGGFLLPALQFGLGIGTSIGGAISQRRAATNAANELSTAGLDAAQRVELGAQNNANSVLMAGNEAATASANAGQTAASNVNAAGAQGRTDILDALKYLDPYSEAGQAALKRLIDGMSPGGEFSGSFNGTDFRNDAGLAFRTKYGSDAITNSAIARTGAVGGNLGRALIDYNQGAASEEYDKAFQRFVQNRKMQMDPLQSLVNTGVTVNQQRLQGSEALADLGSRTALNANNFITSGVRDANQFRTAGVNNAATLQQRGTEVGAGYRTDAASARAAGITGRANAFSQLLNNGGRAASSFVGSLLQPRMGGGFVAGGAVPGDSDDFEGMN